MATKLGKEMPKEWHVWTLQTWCPEESKGTSRLIEVVDPAFDALVGVVVHQVCYPRPFVLSGVGFFYGSLQKGACVRDFLLTLFGSEDRLDRFVSVPASAWSQLQEDRIVMLTSAKAGHRNGDAYDRVEEEFRPRYRVETFVSARSFFVEPPPEVTDYVETLLRRREAIEGFAAREEFNSTKTAAIEAVASLRKRDKKTVTPRSHTKVTDKDLRSMIKGLVDARSRNSIMLARAFFRVHKQELYQAWGFQSFEVYCEKELSISWQNGYQYARLGRFILENNITDDQAGAVGWTKLQRIAGLGRTSGIKNALEYAEKHTVAETVIYCDKLKYGGVPYWKKDILKQFTVKLPHGLHEELSTILESVWDRNRLKSRGEVILEALRLYADRQLETFKKSDTKQAAVK